MRNVKNIKNVLPGLFCIEDIQCSTCDTESFNYRATLYHDQACITVSFNCAERDPNLGNGEFVTVCWLPEMRSDGGAIQVAGLTVLGYPSGNSARRNFNPFLSVPHTWSVDRHLINCARDLWDISSKEMRQLLIASVLVRTGRSGMKSAVGRVVGANLFARTTGCVRMNSHLQAGHQKAARSGNTVKS